VTHSVTVTYINCILVLDDMYLTTTNLLRVNRPEPLRLRSQLRTSHLSSQPARSLLQHQHLARLASLNDAARHVQFQHSSRALVASIDDKFVNLLRRGSSAPLSCAAPPLPPMGSASAPVLCRACRRLDGAVASLWSSGHGTRAICVVVLCGLPCACALLQLQKRKGLTRVEFIFTDGL